MKPGAAGLDSERNLEALLFVRVATGTALLLPVLYLQLLPGTEASLVPLYGLIGALFGVSIAFALAHRAFGRRSAFVVGQLTADVILASALVYALGGVRSPFVLIYLIIAFAAGVMAQPQTALAIACWNGVAYGLMAHLAAASWLPRWDFAFGPRVEVSAAEMYLRIFSVLLASCLVASVAGSYAARLRRARQELRRERSTLDAVRQLNEQLLAGMSSGLIAADADGIIVACNRAAERITQRIESELVGHQSAAVLGFDSEALADLDQRVREHQIYRTERQLRLPSGDVRAVGMSVTRVVDAAMGESAASGGHADSEATRSPGGPWQVKTEGPIAGGYIFMFQDLTDIKRMERLFWIRERMAVLGEMASSLAHEIRNPLGSISGSLQMLRGGRIDLSSERAHRLMEIVTKESERLSGIIENFLDYARPEKLDAADCDLGSLARETIELLQNSREFGEGYTMEVVAAEPVSALVDAGRIKQVFWNLARNALQSMPTGGVLRIELSRIDRGAHVVVGDTGRGMTPEQVEKVFRPFVSHSSAGTGLGLAVVYRIMQMHGARVELESDPGSGTRVMLWFDDAKVPDGDDLVIVERQAEEDTRLFDALSRSVQS